jgi:hypothetical protein
MPVNKVVCGPLDAGQSSSVYRLGVLRGRVDRVETPQASDERHDRDNDIANQRDGDRREDLADQREAELDAREVRADARDAAQAARHERALHILNSADTRDDQAEARDSAATTRDTAASLHSFLQDGENEYGTALKARRSAALDRTDSKADRTSAAADRTKLTEDDPTPPDVDNG